MFSDVRSRIQRVGLGGNSIGPVTESDVRELRLEAGVLRKQLQRIVDEEIAPNSEARVVATDGMEMLRKETEQNRSQRDELQDKLNEVKSELGRIEDECAQEREGIEFCREDALRTRANAQTTREEVVNLKAESEQLAFFQEDVDMETKHRLRADVQNLETGKERDQIRLRHLNAERNELRKDMDELRALRDAHQIVAAEQQREVEEAKMTLDMYRAHHEALGLHLKHLGGDPRSSLFDGISFRIKGLFGEKLLGELGSKENSFKIARRRDESQCEGDTPKKQQLAKIPEQHDNSRKEKTKQVGGIVFEPDSAESPSEFLRKLPTIFKMGSGVAAGLENGGQNDYLARREREVEFNVDSNSVSMISAITMDDAEFLESLSDNMDDYDELT